MKVYIVISNGEVAGEIEGVYQNYQDAVKKFEEVKQDWLDWAGDSGEVDEYQDNFSLSTDEEYLEVKISTVELQ